MKILFAADMSFNYMEATPDTQKAVNCMAEIAPIFKSADFSILNLENILGVREKYTPIIKSGPNLISDERFIEYINVLKPTAVGLANNHTGDYGDEPIFNTIDLLHKNGYLICGAGANIDYAYKPVKFSKEGITVSVIAVCENEFGVATKNEAGSAGYRLSLVTREIELAKANGEKPIIYFHGGNEYDPFPSPEKVELYRHFIDLGAAAVIAMHTHCPQGYELYNGSPIVYSMGNFFFPHSKEGVRASWFYGYMTELDVTEKGITIKTYPYTFDFDKISLLVGAKKEKFNEYMEVLCAPLNDERKIAELFDTWCIIAGINGYIKMLNYNEAVQAKKSSAASLKNIFSCEAHNELIKNTLNMMFFDRVKSAEKDVGFIEKLQNMEIQ